MMRRMIAAIPVFILLLVLPALTQERALTNADVARMVSAGLSESVILTRIRTGETEFKLDPDGLIGLKNAGVPDSIVNAMLEAGKRNKLGKGRITDQLGGHFSVLKNTVVTVWSEVGRGSGFIISGDGLIVTNFHVIGPSRYVAVQFDPETKVPAKILATDQENDIAVLWANIRPFHGAVAAKLAISSNEPGVIEGERVMAIGSPLNQRKIMTTGVVSKIETRAIISDININPGNSGGPLFNSLGKVAGICTFGDVGRIGQGLSGIVRIEQAKPAIEKARAVIAGGTEPPSGNLLPVEPAGTYPLDAIREVAYAKKFDDDPYRAEAGKFRLSLYTPRYKYRLATENERQALKGRKGRERKNEIKGTFNPFQGLYGWAEYLGQYKPVLQIRATPEIKETTGSIFGRALLGSIGVRGQANLKFKADFYTMKLYCGNDVVEPIQPSKIAYLSNTSNWLFKLKDATYEGLYTYPPNAINPRCGTVRIEVFSEKKPKMAQTKRLKPKEITRIIEDFKPYFEFAGKKTVEQ